jgi:hypothetical protein
VARYLPHPDVTCVPIRGIEGSTVALAWPTMRDDQAVADFVATARSVTAREVDLVYAIEHPFDPDPKSPASHGPDSIRSRPTAV